MENNEKREARRMTDINPDFVGLLQEIAEALNNGAADVATMRKNVDDMMTTSRALLEYLTQQLEVASQRLEVASQVNDSIKRVGKSLEGISSQIAVKQQKFGMIDSILSAATKDSERV